MQWKPRGGGGAALMTVDRDGTLRLWAKVDAAKTAARSASSPPAGAREPALPDPGTWMEEVARSPHVEDTPRAGAAFVHWGGGGGVADDESDSAAGAAAHPFVAHGAAPKPSRALHWIVRVAAGDVRAWRVRGLDDRPRPEFARLEPGCGSALMTGSREYVDEGDGDGELHESSFSPTSGAVKVGSRNALDGAIVLATRALAPVPLTTSNSRRVGLVKSYATSNGERRLRSPEPPEPPTMAATFVLLTRNGRVHLARYDLSPTDDAHAVCRARVGAGHLSTIRSLVVYPDSFSADDAGASSRHESSTSWLLSEGADGDTLLWRADAASPTREPLVLTALLPGPHVAATFAPASLASPRNRDNVVAMFGIDAIAGTLHLYQLPVRARRRTCSSVQSVNLAQRIVSCSAGNNTGDTIRKLLSVPLLSQKPRRHPTRSMSLSAPQNCLLIGFGGNGRACCWYVSRLKQVAEAHFEPAMMRFSGRRFGVVTAADSAVELGTGRRLIAVGSIDGCVRLYEVVHDPDVVDSDTGSEDGIMSYIERESADPESEEEDANGGRFGDGGLDGVVRFRELAFLGEKDGSEARVSHVSIMSGGERVGVTREDGSVTLWERSLAAENAWNVVLSLEPNSVTQRASSVDGLSESSLPVISTESGAPVVAGAPGGLSFGRDAAGQVVLFVSRKGCDPEVFRKRKGTSWERVVLAAREASVIGPMTHIGLGVVVLGSGREMLAYDAALSGGSSYAEDGAGYSPARDLLAHLFAGGNAWQTISALNELSLNVETASSRVLSSSSGMANRALKPRPPSLRDILSSSETAVVKLTDTGPDAAQRELTSRSPTRGHVSAGISDLPPQNLFAELMAKSEAKFAAESVVPKKAMGVSFDSDIQANDSLSKLSKRLRMFDIAGLSRTDHKALKALANAGSSVRGMLSSLDPAGCRFALLAATFLDASPSLALPPAAFACAVHSSAADALSSHFLPADTSSAGRVRLTSSGPKPPSMWAYAKRLGAGWWVSTHTGAQSLIERIARTDFSRTRDADSAALWYIALGRQKPLSALYRAQQNLRTAQFLTRNFSLPENQIAASKNAYVLVSKHRHFMATAFFILAGDMRAALSFVRARMKDDQLALLLARVLADGAHVDFVLESMLASDDVKSDRHRRGMALWLSGRHTEALEVVGSREAVGTESEEAADELEVALGSSLPPSALSLGHLTAMTSRPPLRGLPKSLLAVSSGRERAMHALTGDGSPVVALSIGLRLLGDGLDPRDVACANSETMNGDQSGGTPGSVLGRSRRVSVIRHVASTAAVALKARTVAGSVAVRFGVSQGGLLEKTEMELRDLCQEHLALSKGVRIACTAAAELSRIDEVDSALALALGAVRLCRNGSAESSMVGVAESRVEDVCFHASARAVSKCLCALSPLHRPNATVSELYALCGKMKSAVRMLRSLESISSKLSFDLGQLHDSMNRAILALKIARAYLCGDWADLLSVLRACEHPPASLRLPRLAGTLEELDEDDGLSRRSTNSSLAPESISLENLRHIASNPAVLGISPNIGHRRRRRRAPSLALVDQDGVGLAAVQDENAASSPTIALTSGDPLEFIRAHPALNSALGSSCIAYLAAHQAARAARLTSRSSRGYEGSAAVSIHDVMNISRVLEASETLEHVSADAIAGWIPLARFGSAQDPASGASREEMAGAFVDLWCALGCLPEYAPSLSEAATVAAAELASAAALRAIAEENSSSRSARRRRRRRQSPAHGGGRAEASKSIDIFDTTSADSLYGAYPVRFSASAGGPWSGRGRFACLYRENSALFRTLCISSSDPPAVIVATPKGIQEVVPSSYTAMPAGFRSHYSASRQRYTNDHEPSSRESTDGPGYGGSGGRGSPLQDIVADPTHQLVAGLETGYGESSYMALDLNSNGADGEYGFSGRRAGYASGGRRAVWRHQVEATALASHPLRRRFASGGTDGVVRLWECGDPISLGALRSKGNLGRVSALKFSAYGSALVSVHSSGHVTVWHEPDSCISTTISGLRDRDITLIDAFQHRNASDVVFLDQGFMIAAVGDPSSPPAVGHSLRIFDTREPNVAFQASWSARVHNGGEARCLALLEDRVRVVTGGLDGSLSVVDLRMSKSATQSANQARVSELPAHDDEVTCLTLESPRGRALVSGCRNGDIKIWDARTLLQLDHIHVAHPPTRHYWSGSGIGGMVGSYGTQAVALTDRSLISCGGDGILKVWGPGYSTSDLNVL